MEAVVEFEYTAEQDDELNLKVGDVITNVQTAEGGWWEGELKGKKGMFPENFVKLVKRREQSTTKNVEKREAAQRKSVRELANKFKDGIPIGGPPKKKEKKKRCKVLFEYKKLNDDELELAVGEIVDFHKQVEEGWWEGTLNGKHGVFPSNFVEMIEDAGSSDEGSTPAGPEKEEKPTEPQVKDGSEFHTIKGKKVMGVGLGNIFGSGPIKLRSTATDKKEETPKATKPEPEITPEVAKREKQNTSERAIVRFSYGADQPDELSLTEGQIVKIIEKDLEDEGWWKGEVNGKVGVFPDNFVEILPPEEPSKPKKPPPPAASAKQALHPKLTEKAPAGDSLDDKSKSESPAVGKKPQAPPPIGKKPFGQKSADKPESSLPIRPVVGLKDSKTTSRENHTDDKTSPDDPANFDTIESTGQKLTHLTANRAKGPKKRPPSTVLNLNDVEKENESAEEIKSNQGPKMGDTRSHGHHQTEKPERPVLPSKESKHQSSEHEPSHVSSNIPHSTISAHRDPSHSSGPPPRPPEPTTAPPSSHGNFAQNTQTTKLLEQLQRDLNELRANTVSKSAFNELRAEHDKLKSEFENLKNNHAKKIRDLMNEVDEEKKLRLTTQVEIERVKKFMSETNV